MGFYYKVLIVPAIVITSSLLLSCLIPIELGERISFVVTIVLAVVIFLLMFAEQLPKTHEETRVTSIFAWILYTAVGFMALTIIHTHVKHALKVRADVREQTLKREEEK